MRAAAADLNFEMAAELRDKMIELKKIWQNWIHSLSAAAISEQGYL